MYENEGKVISNQLLIILSCVGTKNKEMQAHYKYQRTLFLGSLCILVYIQLKSRTDQIASNYLFLHFITIFYFAWNKWNQKHVKGQAEI